MFLSVLPLTLLLVIEAHAQTSSSSPIASSGATAIVLSGSNIPSTSIPNLGGDLVPTGPQVSYITYSTTSTDNGTIAVLATTFAEINGSFTPASSTQSAPSASVSLLVGGAGRASSTITANGTMMANSTSNSTASITSTSVAPTNTQPCNNYPEFCSRKYSNITYIGAHNGPFVNPNNAAANQQLGVIDQLNDGIRMLQGQTHFNATTKTISYCHTSCDLLDAGTAESYFANITGWVRNHPYDVVTILIGNSDFIGVGNYTVPLVASGLAKYAYVPSQVPMNISAWPTLSRMIITQKRVVIFMDYNANQTEVPYILDEFSQMWETPFSPTDRSFPCTQQRPPDLSRQDAEQRMYMANHNLNTEISIAGASLLVPTTALINETNAVSGNGSLGKMANDCAAAWPRPPNFLLVDYYNEGSSPGSVFEVAAQHNNVTYNRPCCGMVPSAADRSRGRGVSSIAALGALAALTVFAFSCSL